jgi:hypothetical protein
MTPEIISSSIIGFVGIIVSIAAFLSIRTLQQIDRNQAKMAETMSSTFKDIYEKHNILNVEFHEMRAEHHMNHDRRKQPRVEWPGHKKEK